ncbi:MAG: RdgB/HAM1 family non-canonical purine NTP pyrophosphatase [Candidatus Goldbacteria bacterium]|nr:RdgB/HAM1 family non-canonical purine NTP pyrophosphatase [Candidatus Goldiibacteriota bacterium]
MKIVLATNNKHKIKEIKEIIKDKNFKVLTLQDINFNKPIKETGTTIADNAKIKARSVRKYIKDAIILSDDTGLEVDFLAKAPGVYSSRFAGPGCTYEDNYNKLLKLLNDVPWRQRKATFKTAVCIILPDGKEKLVIGKVNGYISFEPRGKNGFGYDPVFYFPKKGKTFAEMTLKEKNKISHRKNAFLKAFIYIKKIFKNKKDC